MKTHQVHLCSVCAWRAFCQKKFSMPQEGWFNCPDFSRDVTIPQEEVPEEEEGYAP